MRHSRRCLECEASHSNSKSLSSHDQLHLAARWVVTVGNGQNPPRHNPPDIIPRLSLSVLSHVFGAVDKTSSLVFQRTVK